ncbi:MAG: hypothetical protein ACJ8F1_11895 [Polyangia bacterium]|jgi:hypothetical protein
MSLKRFTNLCVLAAVAAFVIVSCGERSLVVMDVKSANGSIAFTDVTLLVRAGLQQQTRFDKIHFDSAKAYRAGVYLPSDISGMVTLTAEVDDPAQNCKVGIGSLAVSNVSPGNTVQGLTLIIQPLQPCVPIVDGGTTGDGGSPGTGGTRGSGGTQGAGGSNATGGRGGSLGTGGVGQGGTLGSGGMPAGGHGGGTVGTGGLNGTGGVVGTGGTLGTGGVASTGGTIGTGGVKGTGGTVGTGGVLGSGGVLGTGGLNGTGGIQGTGGLNGSGGSGGCKCTNPNEVCDSTGACVCNQSDADACAAAGVSCGTSVVNNCDQKVSCVCPTGYLCNTTTFTCISRCIGGTGGIVAAGASDAIICPPPPVTTQ